MPRLNFFPCLRTAAITVVKNIILPFILIITLGCGLADYENRMEEQEKRIKIFDEVQGRLGPPLTLPEAKPGDQDLPMVTLLNIFLRPPRTIQSTPSGQSPYGKKFKLFDYPGEVKDHLLLGAMDSSHQEDSAEAAKEVKKSLEDFYAKNFPKRVNLEFPTLQVLKIPTLATSSGGKERVFYSTTAEARVEDNVVINHLFLTKEQKCWTTLVYIYPVSGNTPSRTIPDLVTFSLKTFAGGSEGVVQRKLFYLSNSRR